jgi:TetR/AcrR family transcriptional regulator, repressor for neighboring sulfatase
MSTIYNIVNSEDVLLSSDKLQSKNKRIRRTSEDARQLILEAAEAGMAASGPAGLRLQEVAKAAGVSHPTILHHFGSREGLIQALNLKTIEHLKSVLLQVMGAGPSSSEDAITSTFAAYRDGLAQRMVWLMQSQAPMGAVGLPVFDELVEALHAMRLRMAGPDRHFDIADTRAIVHLTTIAAFGDAILGRRLRRAQDPDAEIAQREWFENWFGDLLNVYMTRKR